MEQASLLTLPTYRPPVRTTYELGEAADTLKGIVSPILDANGEEVCLMVAKGLAQLSFETATFASCWCHNVGNLRTGKRGTGVAFTLIPGAVDEYAVNEQGKMVRYVAKRETDPLRIFAAYDTAPEGFGAWLALVRDRYPRAWEKLIDPRASVADFVLALAADPVWKYYTASPKVYAAGAVGRYHLCLAAAMGRKLAPVLRLGSKGDAVREWQVALRNNGKPVPLSGEFDWATKDATECWQETRGLANDGVVGPVSLEVMGFSPFAEAA